MTVKFSEYNAAGSNLLVVDALNLAFRWQHQGVSTFCDSYISTVKSLAKSYKAKHIIVAADKGNSQFRKDLYPEYKQNRKERFEKQTEAEKQQFEEFFQEFEHTLDTLAEQYPVLRFQGVEADDIAAYVVSQQKHLDCEHIWLVSSDRDWDLLVDSRVSRFSYVTRKEVTLENWHDTYEFSTEDYISIKCLTGDTGDNVPGVPGIGPKRALDLVREYGSTWDIIAHLPILGKKHKYIQALNESKQQLELNYKLMDLVTHCREAIGTTNLKTIDSTLELLK